MDDHAQRARWLVPSSPPPPPLRMHEEGTRWKEISSSAIMRIPMRRSVAAGTVPRAARSAKTLYRADRHGVLDQITGWAPVFAPMFRGELVPDGVAGHDAGHSLALDGAMEVLPHALQFLLRPESHHRELRASDAPRRASLRLLLWVALIHGGKSCCVDGQELELLRRSAAADATSSSRRPSPPRCAAAAPSGAEQQSSRPMRRHRRVAVAFSAEASIGSATRFGGAP